VTTFGRSNVKRIQGKQINDLGNMRVTCGFGWVCLRSLDSQGQQALQIDRLDFNKISFIEPVLVTLFRPSLFETASVDLQSDTTVPLPYILAQRPMSALIRLRTVVVEVGLTYSTQSPRRYMVPDGLQIFRDNLPMPRYAIRTK
jgi:hypothetical protein